MVVAELGKPESYSAEDWLNLGGTVRGLLAGREATTAHVFLDRNGGAIGAEEAANFSLGLLLRGYKFEKYKTKAPKKSANSKGKSDDKNDRTLKKIVVHCDDPKAATRAFAASRAILDGVTLARDLVNEPANVLGPQEFAARTKELTKLGVQVEVMGPRVLERLGMNALLAVGQGSERPSQVVVMQWKGAGARAGEPIAFIGKGVTFDTGGISIKPAAGMEDMKGDMAGAAAVVGLMRALAERKAKVNAVGIIGLVENMPSGKAQRPGDVVKAMSGQTIEVLNTDAEGRMVLADCLWYAQHRFKPKAMVNLATLTGAVMVALGKEHAGLFSNNDQLTEWLIEAGKETGEKLWRLPLGPKYDKMINSKVADMKNTGGKWGGSIIGRAVPPALRQRGDALGASRHRRHRDVVGRQRDQSELGIRLWRAPARPARARSLRAALRSQRRDVALRSADGATRWAARCSDLNCSANYSARPTGPLNRPSKYIFHNIPYANPGYVAENGVSPVSY